MREYLAGCEALGADKRNNCLERGKTIYAGRGKKASEAGPSAVAAPAASATSAAAVVTAPALLRGTPQPTAYAIIVGIEHYEGLPAPAGAVRDAEAFARLARDTLGIPVDHIKLLLDAKATKGGLERSLEWVGGNVKAGGRVYFYYSGHGAPDARSGTAYLVPFDGDPAYLESSALPLSTVTQRLAQTPAKEIVAVFDSCFSGAGGRSVLAAGARPLVRVKEPAVPSGRASVAVFTASAGNETSGPSSAGGEGLFSKFLMQGLGTGQADLDGDGQVSIAELAAWVTPRVAREAQEANREQHPVLTLSKEMGKGEDFILGWGLAK